MQSFLTGLEPTNTIKIKRDKTTTNKLIFLLNSLQSAYLMTEVMKEREEQIKLKQMLADNDKIREKQWADKVKEENEKIMEIEKLRIMEIRKSLMEKAEFVKSQ